MESDVIIIDWFAMTSRVDDERQLLALLEINDENVKFTESYGFYGYRRSLYFNGIRIHYDYCKGDSNYPLLEMSGQGCRAFETYTDGNWERLFTLALDSERYNITRIDLAYDDHSGLLDIKKIEKAHRNFDYISRTRKGSVTISTTYEDKEGVCVMFGVKQSDYYVRFYDKAKERGDFESHWIRCEQILKHDRALAFLQVLADNPKDLGRIFSGILLNYIRFAKRTNDPNRSRWPTERWYLKFLGECEKIRLYSKKDVEYNMFRLKSYLQHQAGNSLETLIRCEGLEGLRKIIIGKDSHLNADQLRLIEEYEGLCTTDFTSKWVSS